MREYLDTICSLPKNEKSMFAEFKIISYSVRYKNPLAKTSKSHLVNIVLFYERIFIYIYIYICIYLDNIIPLRMSTIMILKQKT